MSSGNDQSGFKTPNIVGVQPVILIPNIPPVYPSQPPATQGLIGTSPLNNESSAPVAAIVPANALQLQTLLGIGSNGLPVGLPTFIPRNIAGLLAWYRADLGFTGGRWLDQSNTGDPQKNLLQPVVAQQPTLNSADAAYNHQSTLSFASAATQFMASGVWASPLAQPYTIIAIGNDDGGVVKNEGYAANLAGNERMGTFAGGDTYDLWDGGANVLTDGTALSSTPRVLIGIFNGASSEIFNNAMTVKAIGNAGANNLTGFVAAAFSSSGLAPLNGKLAELMVYGGILSQASINAILTYASQRYGIAIGP